MALLHVSGRDGEGRLARALSAQGFDVQTAFLYGVEAATELPATARAALSSGALDAVLLFSPRGAKTFSYLVGQAGLSDGAAKIMAVCISRNAADALSPLAFREIRIADRRTRRRCWPVWTEAVV